MAKKFRISNGLESIEWTKAQWSSARNEAFLCPPDFVFEIYGKEVDRDGFIDACERDYESWRSNYREVTIKNGVCAGVSVNGYKTILVKK